MKKFILFLFIVGTGLSVGYCVHKQEEKHKKVVASVATLTKIYNGSKDTALMLLLALLQGVYNKYHLFHLLQIQLLDKEVYKELLNSLPETLQLHMLQIV